MLEKRVPNHPSHPTIRQLYGRWNRGNDQHQPRMVIQETMHSLISGQQAIQGATHSLLSAYRFIRGTTESRTNDQRACSQTFHPSQRTQENNTVYQQQRSLELRTERERNDLSPGEASYLSNRLKSVEGKD
ncbi:hypothetical protein TNCV_4313831 [Trichonephila clavipes]|nr:hypothetical protein TNCV_4313831 [Trichonephila clavipes]